ncbi:TolC family protein [Pontibacter amylolyticus]|uniref:Transporter n=1 Tax=Pontibacter amylolyticus TaxID=1424080 RepID=A0ABQ1W7K7_9BACT|nr:TolC family protein [Pontibacter amylolyticus]GGG15300.1 transporter [Pontibacter amylolyticus]
MKKILAFISLLLGAMPLAQAQTLEEYLVEAGENSPTLKARYAEYQAALQRAPQVGALPDPEASFNFFLQPMERYMGNEVGGVSVMQMFPWFGSNKAAKDEANYMAQMKFTSFIEAKINLYHDIRTVWYQLYLNDQESILMEREVEIMKTLERLALAKYTSAPAGGNSGAATPARSTAGGSGSSSGAVSGGSSGMAGMGGSGGSAAGNAGSSGNMAAGSSMSSMGSSGGSSMVDVMLIRLQLKELENQMHIHHEARRPLQVQFNQLLRRRPSMTVLSADTLLPVPLPATLSLIEDSIRSNHPMLKMYEWDEKARQSQLRMAQLMGRPMFGLGLNYMIFQPRMDDGMMMGGENMIMPMVSVTLPIYRKKYSAARKEAEYSQQAAVYQKEATERELFTELENLLYQYQSAVSRISLLKDQITLTEQTIRLLTINYSVSGTGIDEIIRQRQSLLSYKQQQVQAITNQHIAVSGINRMMQGDN